MSMNNLTIDGEFRYIVQWFNEWSELQRDDFVPILLKYITGSHVNDDEHNDLFETTATTVNMNGLPNELEFNGRPMSLFQCRIKLFNQWNRRWPTDFKEKLQQKITDIDGKVGEKINYGLNPNNVLNLTNGYGSKEQDQQNSDQLRFNNPSFVTVSDAMVLNDPMEEVLNNETSVDDIETNEDCNNSIEKPLSNNVQHADDNDHAADGNDNNDEVCSSNRTNRNNQKFNEHAELVEQVVQMQCLQINEEKAEAGKEIKDEDDSANVEHIHQQQIIPSVTVTVNPVVVTQAITTNAEVPLVI